MFCRVIYKTARDMNKLLLTAKKLISTGFSAIAKGTREFLEITTFAISVGVQLLAAAGKTERLEQI